MSDLATLEKAYTDLNSTRPVIDRAFSYGASNVPLKKPEKAFLYDKYGFAADTVPDMNGMALFKMVINDPGYRVYRDECALLQTQEMTSWVQNFRAVMELGPGDGRKTALLLSECGENLQSYIGFEQAKDYFPRIRSEIQNVKPDIAIALRDDNFTQDGFFAALGRNKASARFAEPLLVTTLGTTFGNYENDTVVDILNACRENMLQQPDSRMLIGQDCTQDMAILQKAYNNPITAVFFINGMRAINDLGADFDITQYGYGINWNEKNNCVDMTLRAKTPQKVTFDFIDGYKSITVLEGQEILVGTSRKFKKEELLSLYQQSGLVVDESIGVLEKSGICLFPLRNAKGLTQ